MASDIKLGTSGRDAGCDGIVDEVDAGAGAGTIVIRTGAPPATPATADSGTLLGTLTCSDPAFDDAGSAGGNADGLATANSIASDTSADATGIAGYFRIRDSNTVVIWQGTAGESADTPDLEFDDKNIVIGGTIAISSLTATMPEQ